MTKKDKKRVAIIGAGLGGLSAAISLATMGYSVRMFEKNDRVGGKLNQLKKEGFTFDLGPSILTLPHLFRRLWEKAGRKMEDYIRLKAVTPHWRNFFEDGMVIDLYMEWEQMKAEVTKVGDDRLVQQISDFLEYSKQQYKLIESGYFEQGLDTKRDLIRFYDWKSLLRMDYWHTMHGGVRKRIKNKYFIDIFDYFIKYVGSSPYGAPGFMNLMPSIQFEHDLWYVEGGMYRLAEALKRLAEESGASIYLNTEITRIEKQGQWVTGVVDRYGTSHAADIVVSNMEVIPAYEYLLKEDADFLKTLLKLEPACSGLVLHIGTDRQYTQLAHHNFFYSRNQKRHFDTVFKKGEIPEDPTLYVVAPIQSDPKVCPPGCDNIKVLPHIPYLHSRHNPDTEAYKALRERVLFKLERMGLTDLRKHIIFEDMWTPYDIRRHYYSNGGSIYGVTADRWKNFALKAPKQSELYENLFFVGGSVNPGGGMPMVILCGQNVAKLISLKMPPQG